MSMGTLSCAGCGAGLSQDHGPGAKLCPSCCDASGHVLHRHEHPMVPVVPEPGKPPPKVKARSRPCSGKFWCIRCRSWLDGPACEQVTRAA